MPIARKWIQLLVRGIGSSSQFLQDTQTRIHEVNRVNWIINNDDIEENTVLFITETNPVLLELPLAPIPNYGGRVTVWNPLGTEITVQGSRNTSVSNTFSVTTSATRFDIKNEQRDADSFYVNYSIITSG